MCIFVKCSSCVSPYLSSLHSPISPWVVYFSLLPIQNFPIWLGFFCCLCCSCAHNFLLFSNYWLTIDRIILFFWKVVILFKFRFWCSCTSERLLLNYLTEFPSNPWTIFCVRPHKGVLEMYHPFQILELYFVCSVVN